MDIKISKAKNEKPICLDGINYQSLREASRKTGVPYGYINRAMKALDLSSLSEKEFKVQVVVLHKISKVKGDI